jgi:hypothetical protein
MCSPFVMHTQTMQDAQERHRGYRPNGAKMQKIRIKAASAELTRLVLSPVLFQSH